MVHFESYALNVLLLSACTASLGLASAIPPQVKDPFTVDTAFASEFVPGVPAVTYDRMRIPETGKVRVTVTGDGTVQEVHLAVVGLYPGHRFGSHLHQEECGPTGADAGPRYQHTVDPAATPDRPSTDPAFANPRNEVWLDFTTDNNGVATASAVHPWPFDLNRPPHSLVIYDEGTKTAAGLAGLAGERLACVNLAT